MNTQAPHSWRSHIIALFRLGMPLIGAQMAQFALQLTDTAMVGRLGTRELAGTALASQYYFFIFMFGNGFLIAVSPLVAQAVGKGDSQAVRRAARMGFWFAALYGCLASPLLLLVRPVLIALGQDPALAAIAFDYISVAWIGMVPALMFMVLRAFLSSIDRAGALLVAALVAIGVNALLDYAFIFGHFGMPALGVRGAALATVVTNLFLATALGLYAARDARARSYELFVRLWRADWPVFGQLVALGLPITLTIMAEIGLFQLTALMAGWLGVVPLAAHAIVLQLVSFAFMIPLGLSSAATVRVGMAVGAERQNDAGRAAIAALMASAVFAALSIAIFVAWPERLLSVFLSESDPLAARTLELAVPLLMIGAAFQLADGLQAMGAGNLRGLKDTRVPMMIAIISYWGVGVPSAWGLAFAAEWGVRGLWVGVALGLAVAAVLLNLRFFARLATLKRDQVIPAS